MPVIDVDVTDSGLDELSDIFDGPEGPDQVVRALILALRNERASKGTLWDVTAYERPDRRGRVVVKRYAVLAKNEEEAMAWTRVEHEHPGLPESAGSRYVVESADRCHATGMTRTVWRATADAALEAFVERRRRRYAAASRRTT